MMQNEKCEMQNGLCGSMRAGVGFALFVAIALCLVSCGQKSVPEQRDDPVNKEEIKAKILEKDVQPSAEALARKEKSLVKLQQKNVPTIAHLPVIEDSQTAKRRTKEEIAHRAI